MRFITLTIIIFIFLQSNTIAQVIVKGVIKDQQQNPIALASVYLTNEIVITETSSDQTGSFQLESSTGEHQLVIIYLGHRLLDTSINLSNNIDLHLTLNLPSDHLQTVTVQAIQSWLKSDFNQKILTVDKSPYAKGFSARDVIQLFPGIIIDQNGISQFGLGQIMVSINGKISSLTGQQLIEFLRNIPSDLIEKIEYNKHTGALLDANSAGATLNIVYKQSPKTTTSSNVFLEQDQNKYSIQKLGAHYALFSKKLETFLTLNYKNGHEQVVEKRTLDRNIYSWKGEDLTKRRVDPFNGNFYFNWKLNAKTSLGTQIYYTLFNGEQTTQANYRYPDQPTLNYQYRSIGQKLGDLRSYTAFFNQQLSSNWLLKVDWDYIQSKQEDERQLKTSRFVINNNTITENNIFNDNIYRYNNYALNAQVEHHKENFYFQTGAKYSLNRTANDLYTYNQNFSLNLEQIYQVRESIQAAFVDTRYSKNGWNYTAGLRIEQTKFSAGNTSNASPFDYDFLKLFPSFSIGKRLENGTSYNFRYNYGVQRPKFADITPFRKYYDDNAYTVGNPYLRPQFRHFFEFTTTLKNNWDLSLYYALTKNGQAMVFFVDTINNMQVSQPQNFYTLHNLGGSVSKYHQLSERWSLMHFMYVYYNTSRFENTYAEIAEPFNGMAVFYSAQLHYKHKNTFINFSGHVDPPRKAIYFQAKGSYALNVEFDQRFNKVPLKLNVQLRDVFNSSPILHQFRTSGINQSYYHNESSRRLIIRLTWFFKQNGQSSRRSSEYNRESERYKL